ncbi:PREDICTED: uncharacterized protein LOC104587829 isoform X2 [Nelumbo nucifera]|uniref:Uncharacterized protein LOC104587829 isoform X2 n=1 Tax=Nelumbo nucifera TaxID=4432 RepID=A0A1U7YWR7_NELNU|nr:PREDICTED: uncharacterized protein LOC104587829 isoform X2 [Nelumbo nucifera]
MSAVKGSSKRRGKEEVDVLKPEKRKRDEDFDPDLSSDIKGILSALQQIKEKAQKDDQRRSEELISSVASEIKAMLDDARSQFDKERQSFVKALSKSSKECEGSLKNEYTKFQATYEKFCKEKDTHMQILKGTISTLEGLEFNSFHILKKDIVMIILTGNPDHHQSGASKAANNS